MGVCVCVWCVCGTVRRWSVCIALHSNELYRNSSEKRDKKKNVLGVWVPVPVCVRLGGSVSVRVCVSA